MKRDFVKIILSLGLIILPACQSDEPRPPRINVAKIAINTFSPYQTIEKAYTECRVDIGGDGYSFKETKAEIRLRGNSTSLYPKRPFLLKLHGEPSLFNMPSAKAWVLLPDYIDRTMLRSALAFYMGAFSKLQWSPRWTFAEVTFNDEPKGIHVLCEKVQVHPHRVRVPDNGWLVEIDARATPEDVFFRIPHIERPICVHYPSDSVYTPQIAMVTDLFEKADSVLFSASFADLNGGWRQYLDEESWIDWYWINEISKNNDAVFFSSCFLHSNANGRIAMGPIWDFDLSFGNWAYNTCDSPEGWQIRKVMWYTRLFEDPTFAMAAKKRFEWFYSHKENYIKFVRDNARFMKPYADANEDIWHTYDAHIDSSPNSFETYDEHVEALLAWIEHRFEWIKANL